MLDDNNNFYDDLDLGLVSAWNMLGRGSADRRSAFHTPAVTTVDSDGLPQSRIMVLRMVKRQSWQLFFHTDARSAKVSQLNVQRDASVLCYDSKAKIQLRLMGTGQILTEGDLVEAAWSNTSLFGRRCYLAGSAPGDRSDQPTSGLEPALEGRKPEEAETLAGRKNFALLVIDIRSLEWLHLASQGHRRACYIKKTDGVEQHWLVP